MTGEQRPQTVEINFEELIKRWPRTKIYADLFSELEHESERGAVLLVGAALDDTLEELLRARLLPSKSTDELLTGRGPLATFNARIDLCHSLGVISSSEHALLHKLRKIRNDCAHVRSIQFHDAPLKDKCLALEMPYGEIPDERNPARRYVMIAQLLVLVLLWRCSSDNIALTDEPMREPQRTEESVIERFSFELRIPHFRKRH